MAKKAVVKSGPQSAVEQGYAEAEARGGGVRVGAHPEFERPTLLDKVVGAVRRVTNPKPKPIGNSSKDRHNARAAEFAMTEAERERQLRRLDRNIASDRGKK